SGRYRPTSWAQNPGRLNRASRAVVDSNRVEAQPVKAVIGEQDRRVGGGGAQAEDYTLVIERSGAAGSAVVGVEAHADAAKVGHERGLADIDRDQAGRGVGVEGRKAGANAGHRHAVTHVDGVGSGCEAAGA